MVYLYQKFRRKLRWQNFWPSFRYRLASTKGKYTTSGWIESYLDVVPPIFFWYIPINYEYASYTQYYCIALHVVNA